MSANTIDASLLAKMFLSGAKNLEVKKEWINELNVFPVPDGDTGTNMSMTIQSACREVENLSDLTMDTLAKAISSGSLRGARGNSGVILSQLLRGFTKCIKGKTELTAEDLSAACIKATETAYKAVMKPKEGTILTVAKGMSDKCAELTLVPEETGSLEELIEAVYQEGCDVLERTPEMLPVLKEAGVVDSGGQGLMTIIEGALLAFQGKEIEEVSETSDAAETAGAAADETKVTFAYCTEFILTTETPFTDKDEAVMKQYLSMIGDSVVCVPDECVVKIHVHTDEPGKALTKALSYGTLTHIAIENIRIEQLGIQPEKPAPAEEEVPAERKPYGFISVSVGDGIGDIFRELGVDRLIEGGQTMNPSTDDILKAIEKLNADTIYVLPNNKNIVMAANQARDLTEDKQVIVLPTKTIPQGISAMISFVAEQSPEENEEAMKEAIAAVKTAQITYAVRDTVIDGLQIHENDYMAVGDSGILCVGTDLEEVSMEAIEKMTDEDSELISIYYGADYNEEAAQALADRVSEKYDELDVEVNAGGQPIYYSFISVE